MQVVWYDIYMKIANNIIIISISSFLLFSCATGIPQGEWVNSGKNKTATSVAQQWGILIWNII